MRRRRSNRDETGVASVFVLVLTLALLAVAWGAGAIVSTVLAHRTAQNAADLAALAAAHEVAAAGEGCATARDIAIANRARMVSCQIEGSVVTVEVAVTTTFGIDVDLHARARAGP